MFVLTTSRGHIQVPITVLSLQSFVLFLSASNCKMFNEKKS